MNKSDIMKAAELAKRTTSSYKNDEDFARTWEAEIALIAAAELLKQVEVVEAGSEPQIGDVVFCDFMQKSYAVSNASIHSHQITQTVASDNLMRIIQRNGKPVIFEKEGV